MQQEHDNYSLNDTLPSKQDLTINKIGHELRTPLTLIYSNLQLIQKQHPETVTFLHWNQVFEDLEYMELLLKDLTSYTGNSDKNFSLIHTSDFMNSIALSFAASVMEHSIKFTSKIDQNIPWIQGDAVKLRELFFNLLKNAADAVHYNGEIYFHVYKENENIVAKISDNGCGISLEQLNDIFTPFKTYKKNGTGLGLPIVKDIVKLHQGELSVSSDVEIGTTFYVTLPVKQCSENKSCNKSPDVCHIIHSGTCKSMV